jgi:hypothetical protein
MNGNEKWETDTKTLKASDLGDGNIRLQLFDELMGKIVPDEFRTYLIEKGFFTAPASTKYHGAYEGGLFDHSLSVANELKDLSKANRLKWQHPRSPLLIGMFHDLCKIDNYEMIIDPWSW